MDPSALESVSRTLESSLDCWGWSILGATFVVVIGLVIEYWEPVGDFIGELRRPAATFPWRKFWGLTGGILVTVGVAGELGFTYKASRVETKLRENNHKIEESLNASTESAAKASARANKYADGIARLSWPRQLDAEKFVVSLKGKPRARVKLLYNPNDSEAWSFARDIYWWLGNGVGNHEGAGWAVSMPLPIPLKLVNKKLSALNPPIGMRFSGAYTGFGITLRSRDAGTPSAPPLSASACRMKPLSSTCLFFAKEALTDSVLMSMLPDERGGAMEAEYDDSLPNDLIVVIVGPRPPIWHLERPKQP